MKNIPNHIAIIMDGNGHWAQEHGLARAEGHRRGAETIEKIVRACHDRGVKYLTLYAFSEENWMRPSEEVSGLMQLLRIFLASKRDEMLEKGIRFMTIGDVSKLSEDVGRDLAETAEATRGGKDMTLIVALSYGGRQEICRAVTNLLRAGVKEITPERFSSALYTTDIPDPDLLIRTSGEYRISNFLLWQLAYTELFFTEILWPDFGEAELDRAIKSFAGRERRYGLTSEQVAPKASGG
ncbi:MAG: polyprenyl diphosphate synthase [Pseudomonadota bacterium]